MDDMTPTPGIGHNSAGADTAEIDLAKLLDPDVLRDQLTLDHKDIFTRRDALLEAAIRFHERCPIRPQTDDENGKATDFMAQIKKHAKLAETTHETVKKPFLQAGRVVDALFKAETETALKAAANRIEPKVTAYLQHKAAEARRIAQEEADRLARESEKLAAAAAAETNVQQADTTMDRAVEVAERAEQAQKVATSSVADLSRTRGDYGSVASLRDNWTWQVDEGAGGLMALVKAVAEGKAPLHYLTTNDTMITANVKPKTGVREIPGLRIWNNQKAGVR